MIYAITPEEISCWYRHDGRADGSVRWAANTGRQIGSGWTFEHVFAGDGGVIYAVTAQNELLWYRTTNTPTAVRRGPRRTGSRSGPGGLSGRPSPAAMA